MNFDAKFVSPYLICINFYSVFRFKYKRFLVMATATYPPPPPFYRLYKDYLENPNSAPAPPPPIEGTYICYGGNYTVSFLFSIAHSGVDCICVNCI